nr:nuclear transport factor 2 isoform X2 [Camelus dromedarius]
MGKLHPARSGVSIGHLLTLLAYSFSKTFHEGCPALLRTEGEVALIHSSSFPPASGFLGAGQGILWTSFPLPIFLHYYLRPSEFMAPTLKWIGVATISEEMKCHLASKK